MIFIVYELVIFSESKWSMCSDSMTNAVLILDYYELSFSDSKTFSESVLKGIFFTFSTSFVLLKYQ